MKFNHFILNFDQLTKFSFSTCLGGLGRHLYIGQLLLLFLRPQCLPLLEEASWRQMVLPCALRQERHDPGGFGLSWTSLQRLGC